MKLQIALFSKDETYAEYLKKDDRVANVLFFDKMIEGTIHCDAILLVGDVINYNDIKIFREMFPELPIMYRVTGITDMKMIKNVETICAAYKVHTLYEYMTYNQITNDVLQHIFGATQQRKSNVIAFFGTHSGSGVSTTTMNTGKLLSECIHNKVLILSLNAWDPSDYFLSYEGKYLDDIRIELKNNMFTEDSLMQAVHAYSDNLYHLAGNRNIKLQRYYKENEIEQLLEVAKSCFDVVLVDAGSHFDNAAYAQTYITSDFKFLVTTQEEKGYLSYWPHIYNQLIKPLNRSKNEYMLLINRYDPDMSLIKDSSLQEQMGMSLLTTIPNQGIFGQISVTQKKLLIDVVEGKYKDTIQIIVNSIVNRTFLKTKDGIDFTTKKKKIFGIF